MEISQLERRLFEQNSALNSLSRNLSEEQGLEKIARRIVRTVVRVTEANWSSIWLVSPQFRQSVCLAAFDRPTGKYSCGHIAPADEFLAVFNERWERQFVLIRDDKASSVELRFLELLNERTSSRSVLTTAASIEGEPRCVLVLTHPDQSKQWSIDERYFVGSLSNLLSTFLESIENRRIKSELLQKENVYQAIFENTGTATAIIGEDGKTSLVNSEFVRFSGYTREEMEGRMEYPEFFHPAERAGFPEIQEMQGLQSGPSHKSEARFQCKNGEIRDVLVSMEFIPGTLQSVVSVSDLTPQKRVMAQLSHKSLHDELTDLPNRLLFIDRLERALIRSRQDYRFQFSVLYLDLDRFKLVNESFGHEEGDKMLVEVARRIGSCVGHFDTVARFGSDEFAVLLEGISGTMDAIRIADRIHDEVTKPLLIKEERIFPGLSIGIVFSSNPQNYTRAEEIIRDTGIAMSRTKVDEAVKFKIFSRSMHEQAVAQLRLESDLRSGLEQGELVTFFQPLIRLNDLTLTGFEALLRWNHPSKGLISPDVFIPVAEETGMIFPMGTFVLRQALEHLTMWKERFPHKELRIGVNISGRQIAHPEFLKELEQTLKEYECPPSSVLLEITESTLMRDERQSREVLGSLKRMGFTICIDDFGTGYSSLSSLHMLPIDILKIDKIFTCGNGAGMGNEKIVRTIIHLAKDLGLGVVVEGVETSAQLQKLIEIDGDTAQGFLFSSPVPSETATRFLMEGRWSPAGNAKLSNP
jgi:diguanylate cyclase (GGDEF)-like protein/PAS domain S-box-containing protein